MKRLSNLDRVLIVVASTAALMVPFGKADAKVIEAPDRTVSRVDVTYAEPVGTYRYQHRTYFETNDGAAYRYITYGTCVRADAVPNRVCRTVFWYAR